MPTARFALFFIIFFTSLPCSNLKSFKKLCKNGGSIVNEENNVRCECPHPFTGRFCEDFACVNGLSTGDQFDSSSLFFNKRCLCDHGWSGELCDKSLITRCGERGAELEGTCICKDNFAGDRCQYVTKCVHGQLFNGRCTCHYGWSGDFCDSIICHNGIPDADHKSCICPLKYRGKYCDFCAESASSPPPECAEIRKDVVSFSDNNTPILLAIVIILAIVLFGALVYSVCHKLGRRHEKKLVQQRQVNDIEANQSVTGTDEEKCALSHNADIEKVDVPPKYEDIISMTEQNHNLASILNDLAKGKVIKSEETGSDHASALIQED